jgi:alcohol dehydrogenase class IV
MTGAPHGDCLAASLWAGLAYNRPVRREQYAAVARWLGLAGDDAPDEEAAAALVAGCERLRDAVGLPDSFAAVGLGPDDVDAMVENTLVQERRLHTNPREAVADDLEAVLAASLEQGVSRRRPPPSRGRGRCR